MAVWARLYRSCAGTLRTIGVQLELASITLVLFEPLKD